MAQVNERIILEMQTQGHAQSAARVDTVTDAVEQTGEQAQQTESQFAKMAAGIAAAATIAAGAVAAIGQELDLQDISGKLQAQLGTDDSTAALLAKDVGSVYADNFGESFDEVGDAMRASIQAGFANADDGSNIAASKAILGIKAAFGAESDEIARTVGALLNNGMASSSEQAFDIITRGFQKGADKGGEFLDTLNEYSEPFKSLGFSARDATNALVQGSENGVYSVDKIGDAIKEFGIRAVDGSKSTADGFKRIGLDGQAMATKIAQGGPIARQAFAQTIEGLNKLKSPLDRERAGVALFGSMWEDVGAKAILGLNPTTNALGKVKGATDQVNNALGKSFRARFEAIKRAAIGAFSGALIKSVYAVANGIGWIAREFRKGNPVVVFAVTVLGTLTAILTVQALAWGASAAATVAWIAVTKAATVAQRLFNASLLANPLTWVVVLIVGIGVALYKLYQRNETVRKAIDSAWKWIKNAIGNAVEFVRPKLAAFGQIVGAVASAAGTHAKRIIRFWGGVLDFFKALPGRIGGFFKGMWDGVVSAVKGGANLVIGVLNTFIDTYNGTIGKLGALPGVPDIKVDRIPELYTGGHIERGGWAKVGERGPELVRLPSRSTVYDANQTAAALGAGGLGNGTLRLEVVGDDRGLVELAKRLLTLQAEYIPAHT